MVRGRCASSTSQQKRSRSSPRENMGRIGIGRQSRDARQSRRYYDRHREAILERRRLKRRQQQAAARHEARVQVQQQVLKASNATGSHAATNQQAFDVTASRRGSNGDGNREQRLRPPDEALHQKPPRPYGSGPVRHPVQRSPRKVNDLGSSVVLSQMRLRPTPVSGSPPRIVCEECRAVTAPSNMNGKRTDDRNRRACDHRVRYVVPSGVDDPPAVHREPGCIVLYTSRPADPGQSCKSYPSPESVEAVVMRLVEEFHQPTEVVMHSLIIHSGSIEQARLYLSGYAILSAWEAAEDHDLLVGVGAADDELGGLSSYRGEREMAERLSFLDTLPP
ncbi:unnamed protein product (mitochondrion) [Plasmodiophora brassicae]|uniref:Uncharacterized protein n=1 Tax=Plasmodiophora brassicae TaxID=37360 RepID=A0A3P3YKE2_PLABS|nr:unnamed protein product [Plasmodiophora brassicae]